VSTYPGFLPVLDGHHLEGGAHLFKSLKIIPAHPTNPDHPDSNFMILFHIPYLTAHRVYYPLFTLKAGRDVACYVPTTDTGR